MSTTPEQRERLRRWASCPLSGPESAEGVARALLNERDALEARIALILEDQCSPGFCEGGGVFVAEACGDGNCSCKADCPVTSYCACSCGVAAERKALTLEVERLKVLLNAPRVPHCGAGNCECGGCP